MFNCYISHYQRVRLKIQHFKRLAAASKELHRVRSGSMKIRTRLGGHSELNMEKFASKNHSFQVKIVGMFGVFRPIL